MPFDPFWGEGSPTKVDCRLQKKGTLVLTSLLEDLAHCPSLKVSLRVLNCPVTLDKGNHFLGRPFLVGQPPKKEEKGATEQTEN